MSAQSEASRIVLDLVARGFTQTDIARALGLGSKGSGSYVGQIARGVKGSGKVAELRKLSRAASGQSVPGGRSRSATAARRQILGAAKVQRTPRQKKGGGAAAVRKAATKISRRGHVQAFAGKQSLNGPSGGRPVENAIRALAVVDARIAIRVVGRFASDSPAHRSKYWRKFYGKMKHAPGRKRGSANVLEASFAGGGHGLSAADWASFVDAEGSFLGALRAYMDANGYDMPAEFLRVEVTGWHA